MAAKPKIVDDTIGGKGANIAQPEPGVSIAIDNSVLTKLKRGPVEVMIRLTLQVETHDGTLHLRAHLARPRVKRQKAAAVPGSNGAGSQIP